MPIYHQLGTIPHKRHTVLRRDGALLAEELIGNKGFTGPSSLLYHLHQPTPVQAVRKMRDLAWQRDPEPQFRHRHFRTHQLGSGGSLTLDRIPLLFNTDVAMSFVQPTHGDDFFYRNAQGDEVIYASQGSGVLETALGEIAFKDGDYLVIPRGIMHRYRFNPGPLKFLVIESTGYVRTPKRYRNEHGQLTEMAPYSERDIRRPVNLPTVEEKGEFRLVVKKENRLFEMSLVYHPFDLVGWDGFYYPFALSIHDFEPRVGRIHLPPPVPYNHSNVMSDEVIYYASSEFMSRKGIEYGSITLHPDGIPHGPHPGRTEASLGATRTDELAVMVDTFKPFQVSREAIEIEDAEYYHSWLS